MDDKIKITYPGSEKVYMTGKLHPEIKAVGMRKVLEDLRPSPWKTETDRSRKTIYVYDTSGHSDPNVRDDPQTMITPHAGIMDFAAGRREQLDGLTSEYGRMRQEDKSLDHLRFSHIQRPYRAKAGRQVSQMYYAKRWHHHSGNGICSHPGKHELRRTGDRHLYHTRIRTRRNCSRTCRIAGQYQPPEAEPMIIGRNLVKINTNIG